METQSKATIYDLRRARRMTQRQLAKETGITERTIITYETNINNLRKASYENVEKIAEVLQVSIDQIFLSSNSEKPNRIIDNKLT